MITFNVDSRPDSTFGTTGKMRIDFYGDTTYENAEAIALQSGGYGFAVAWLNAVTTATKARIYVQQDANGNGLFDKSEQLWVTYDANYNVTSVMGADAPMERFTYDPYGSCTVLTSGWSSTTDGYNWIYGFQGGRLDPSTGLYTFQRRDYDPALGRWIEQDPAHYIDGSNMYQMEGSSPVDQLDPSGMKAYYYPGSSTWTFRHPELHPYLDKVYAREAALFAKGAGLLGRIIVTVYRPALIFTILGGTRFGEVY